MAQIVTITNPLTGQPAQVDQLEHTAQQIDDAIARALPGGAIDTALQNKAPGGFGWGDAGQYTFSTNDEFKAWFMQNAAPKCFRNTFAASVYIAGVGNQRMLIIASGDYSTAGIVICGYAYDGYELRVTIDDHGIWGPWEWVNPPMALGVEYRTTERYLGKPVYTKAFDFGALPNNTSKDFLLTGLGIKDVIYLSGCVSNNVLEPSALGGLIVSRYADDQRIRITTNGDASAYSAVVVLKYTKRTD